MRILALISAGTALLAAALALMFGAAPAVAVERPDYACQMYARFHNAGTITLGSSDFDRYYMDSSGTCTAAAPGGAVAGAATLTGHVFHVDDVYFCLMLCASYVVDYYSSFADDLSLKLPGRAAFPLAVAFDDKPVATFGGAVDSDPDPEVTDYRNVMYGAGTLTYDRADRFAMQVAFDVRLPD